MPVKPLVVHFTDSSEFAGAEQAMLTMLATLDSSRWKLLLVHHPHQELERLVDGASDLGVETVAVPRMDPGWPGIEKVPRFAGRLRSLRPAIVHFHLTWPLGCQYAIAAGHFARSGALVATAHLYVETSLSARAGLQQRILSRLVDRYLAVSGAVKEELVAKLGWPEKRIEVVHNGVIVPADPPQPDQALRRNMTGGSEGAVVLVPARLTAQKGQSVLLRAAPAIAGAHFVFAGDGPDRAALAALASQLGLDGRVTFLGRRRDVPELIAAADLVVLPSWYEGLPLAVLEAMAAGRPVIASRLPGIQEIITEGADGVLFEPGDPADLARAIGQLLANPSEARRLGAAARRTVADRFSADAMGDRVGQVYAALLGC
jgi:glycosyltransferase involved in cell wall biosynthesis